MQAAVVGPSPDCMENGEWSQEQPGTDGRSSELMSIIVVPPYKVSKFLCYNMFMAGYLKLVILTDMGSPLNCSWYLP